MRRAPSIPLLVALVAGAALAQQPAHVVALARDGGLSLDGAAMDEAALRARLGALVQAGEARVNVAADGAATYTQVMRVMTLVQDCGVTRIALAVRPAEAPDAGPDVPLAAAGAAPAAEPAAAEPPPAEPPPEPPAWKKVVEATGYLDSRSQYSRSRTWGLVPTDEFPQLQELVELNLQVKVSARPRSYLYGDVSLVGSFAGNYRGADADGKEVVVADHNSSMAQPLVSINELYLLHEFVPELNVLVGKKRITWGSGMAYNPTDFINARRDPTDPTFQRAGAWLAQLEVPLSVVTLSAVFVPQVTHQVSSIPTHFVEWPSWDRRDDEAHYQLAARAYALVGDADVNVMLFYGNRFNDDFAKKLRLGLSFSRYFFTDYELHFEALLQSGSTRDFLDAGCVASALDALKCNQRQTPFTTKKYLDDSAIMPRLLVGTRRQFGDDSLLSIEYLYQADGWTKDDFQSFANGLDLVAQGRAAGLPVNRIPGASALFGGSTSADGLPERFTFDPRAQHYLFVTFQKPRIKDDFTASLVMIANLQDLSTLWTPSVAWAATDWLTLTLYGFIPVQGPDALAPKTPAGKAASEYGSLPFAYRVLFEMRAYY